MATALDQDHLEQGPSDDRLRRPIDRSVQSEPERPFAIEDHSP